MTRLEIAHAGPHVTLQDAGRPGLMRFGVPASGPMDRIALAIANAALGNPPGQTGIEVSIAGLTLVAHGEPVGLAIAGGGFHVARNDVPQGAWSSFTLRSGDRLTIRPGLWGSWCCIAFRGRIQSRTWLKSAATHSQSGLGGGALSAGQSLLIDGPRPAPEGRIPCPVWARPRRRLQVTIGPQDNLFPPETLQTLLSTPFRLTPAYDRMGLRLSGPPLVPDGALGIPSQAVTRGAVQVSGDGTATILMADHQTTGGYPKIATVLSPDTDALAQLRPGDAVAFHAVSAPKAIDIARSRSAAMQAFLSRLAAREQS
jgi:allophanate hydrolase